MENDIQKSKAATFLSVHVRGRWELIRRSPSPSWFQSRVEPLDLCAFCIFLFLLISKSNKSDFGFAPDSAAFPFSFFYLWGMALQFSLRDFYDFACRCFWLLSNANCFIIMQSNLCQLCLLMCLFCFGFPDNAGSWITFNKWNKFQTEPLECQS